MPGPKNHYHVSINFYPAPGQVLEADDADTAELLYREQYRIPDHLKVETFAVEPLPNGGWRRLAEQPMPTAQANLKTRYDAICTELATIASTAVSFKSDAGGTRKGELERYRLQLMAELKAIREELLALGATIDADGNLVANDLVFELHTQGY